LKTIKLNLRWKKVNMLRVAGLCGIISPLIAFAFILVAVYYSPHFSWTENWLSDLGGTVMPPDRPCANTSVTEILFNTGLVISGILAVIFSLGLAVGFRKKFKPSGRLGSLLYVLGACALCGIGIFPEPTGTLHTIASVAFFLLEPFAILCIGTSELKSSEKSLGYFSYITGFIALFSIVVVSKAAGETVASLAIAIWTVVFSIRLFRQAAHLI
jgi:hypothetical membrane protein